MKYLCVLFCAVFALSITEPIAAKRFFGGGRSSYPKSGGHSGSHSYPPSGGLSGNHQSGGSHSYPSSTGLSGNSPGHHSGSNQGYPLSGGSGYPSNTHHTSSHSYPAGSGLSGSGNTHTTNVHYHYNYNPPQQIRYTPTYGGAPVSYPVYHGSPPAYVYQYQNSGSKYGTLLAGLALLNLGTVAGGAYALSQSHSNYKPQPGEVCKFGIKKENGDYEETKIDCTLITSFIFQEQEKTQPMNTTITNSTVTVTNVTVVNTTNAGAEENQNPINGLMPNGTLSLNETVNATNETSVANTMTSSVTVTNTTTVVNAVDVKGKPIDVTPGMQCYVIRHTPSTNMKRSVPCGLLQTYAQKSLQKSSASQNVPAFTIISIFAVFLMY